MFLNSSRGWQLLQLGSKRLSFVHSSRVCRVQYSLVHKLLTQAEGVESAVPSCTDTRRGYGLSSGRE